MYLMILEDGDMMQRSEILDGDAESVDVGILEVVRFHDGKYQLWLPRDLPEWVDI